MASFRTLLVWQKANALSNRVDGTAARLQRKRPRLADQLGRCAESVPACIAEGRGRSTDKDFAHFISMAIGSVTELEHHLQRAFDLGFIDSEEHDVLTESAIEVRKMLIGLRRRLVAG